MQGHLMLEAQYLYRRLVSNLPWAFQDCKGCQREQPHTNIRSGERWTDAAPIPRLVRIWQCIECGNKTTT